MSNAIAVARTNTTAGSVRAVTVATKYVKSPDTTGWLRVRLEPTGASAYLPEFLKVSVTKEGERTHFFILEGEYKGKIASLKAENATACLVDRKRGTGAKIIAKSVGRQQLVSKPRGNKRLNQLVANLEFNGVTAMITLDSDVNYYDGPIIRHSKPLPKGTYKILAPQYPKKGDMTDFYVTAPGGYPDLKYHTVWFPIEYAPTKNSNFVHVGNLSEGCVTMYDLTKWNALYQYLISNRLDKEGKYVGTVTIE